MSDSKVPATEANGKKVRQKKDKAAPPSFPEPRQFKGASGTEVRKA